MNTYKITNITNLFGKRDPKFNSITNIEYVDNRTKKIIGLKPTESVFLTVQSLPLSVHRLRIKNMVNIAEVSAVELKKSMTKPKAPRKPKATKKTEPKKEPVVAEKKEPTSTTKKTAPKKKTVQG